MPEIVVEKTEFLEKELNSITGKQKKGIVDVLAKIFLKNGTFEYILFHIEIQRSRDKNFPVRMYNYFNKIWTIHQKPVLSLAILAYKVDGSKIETVWEMHAFGTRLRYEYNLFLTQNLDYEKCLANRNCVEVALGILAPNKTLPLWQRNADVIQQLIQLGYSPEQAHILISFVDRHSYLKANEHEKFEKYISEHKKEVNMIWTSIEEQGIKKGRKEGKLDDLLKIIKYKFGTVPEKLPAELKKVKKLAQLDELIRLAVQVDTLEKMLAEIENINLN